VTSRVQVTSVLCNLCSVTSSSAVFVKVKHAVAAGGWRSLVRSKDFQKICYVLSLPVTTDQCIVAFSVRQLFHTRDHSTEPMLHMF